MKTQKGDDPLAELRDLAAAARAMQSTRYTEGDLKQLLARAAIVREQIQDKVRGESRVAQIPEALLDAVEKYIVRLQARLELRL